MVKELEKFMFNQHIFDEPEEEEEEFEEPPPPTFSEEELEHVRQTTEQEAYNRGKQDGLAESKASRDQMVAQVLQKIGQDASILYAAEDSRDEIFEQESVSLASAIFEKLFPEQKEMHGFAELKGNISKILKRQENQSEIRIEVHPDAVDGVQEHLKTLSLHNQVQQRFDVVGNDALNNQACKMHWKDGGAIRDIDALAEEIRSILNQSLATTPTNSHDSNSDRPTAPTHTDDHSGTPDALSEPTQSAIDDQDTPNNPEDPANGPIDTNDGDTR